MRKIKIDALGRVVIPIKYRKELSINEDSELEMYIEKGKLIVAVVSDECKLCGAKATLSEMGLCEDCIDKVARIKG